MVAALTRLTPPIKWHGGKHFLASKIVALMLPHTHYVEPFAGGLSVRLAKNPEGVSEVVNDLNGALANFWQVLRDEESFDRFRRRAEATPFSERVWADAMALLRTDLVGTDPVEWAWAFFVGCRQSLAGRMDHFTPLSRTRTRRGMNEQASAWLGAIDGLGVVHSRLKQLRS
ncbi:d12 class n6 adenine-specific dna methyltransferase : D12 class N6 adenine-specific DNA methyltransferase OS=Rhodopirellula sallentina SM41 GN=RSSM_03350 PE=4 SV=1: MethyltransfD12 [Gemmata massiliana]|uniref:site-specific DNA-methyltransferase (adenine-specific) n=1 Tax=Gemmata massiliana TaxID=1210884 RepID=A0A6P2D2Q9_9BACT|nr:DNA adenine methylase [Gemmata massiliana]VTR95137.1 d12 class n6 adenine-specific dna methyltransferase : D12 class N6 adenine-specific DNA methyltransferase OS=Rhodopirellula sallentina SM41 GN=RSSM_03350 PE=4 SV=1: MethyltransfD12 [Gemmata massiliana]